MRESVFVTSGSTRDFEKSGNGKWCSCNLSRCQFPRGRDAAVVCPENSLDDNQILYAVSSGGACAGQINARTGTVDA